MSLGPLEVVAAPTIGVLVWHEVRAYGHRIEDQEWVEAAPVLAGVAVALGFGLSAELVQPVAMGGMLDQWDVRRWAWVWGVLYGTTITVLLVLLEAFLHDEGHIDQEWLLFEPFRQDGGNE